MLMEINPPSYTGKNDRDYKVKYEGYKEDRLKAKRNKEKGKKAPNIIRHLQYFEHGFLHNISETKSFTHVKEDFL